MTRTSIEWTDETWNPVTGCSKVSQGCKHCYAERIFPRPYPGRKFTDVRVHEDRLTQPLIWAKPRRVFVNSMSDLFHEDVPFEFIDKVFAAMSATDRHTFQVLTKRPERMLEWFARLTPDENFGMIAGPEEVTAQKIKLRGEPQHDKRRGGYDNCGLDWPLRNVWLGVSVEDQATANARIPLLLQAPAAVRFLSCEPLLGPIDLTTLCDKRPFFGEPRPVDHWSNALTGEHGHWICTAKGVRSDRLPRVDWVIAGGESGPSARPMHPDWVRSLRDQCTAAQVPFFFKQWGEWEIASESNGHHGSKMPDTGERYTWVSFDGRTANPSGLELVNAYAMAKVGKKKSGRMIDGQTWEQFPPVRA